MQYTKPATTHGQGEVIIKYFQRSKRVCIVAIKNSLQCVERIPATVKELLNIQDPIQLTIDVVNFKIKKKYLKKN